MIRTSWMLALVALFLLPASGLAQEPEPTPPAAAEPAEPAAEVEPAPRVRRAPASPPQIRPLVQPRLLVAPVIEAAEPAGDPSEVMPAQAVEPSAEDDAFPEDPAADQAVQQALDDGFGDDGFGDDGFGDDGFGDEGLGDEGLEHEGFGQDLAGPEEGDHAEPEDVHTAAAGEEADHGDSHEPGATHDEEAHGEAHGPNYPAMFLNFLIWGAIIVWLLKKPLSSFLKNRRVAVIEGLEESKRIKAEAEAKHAEYTERLAHLDEELAKLRQEMIQAGEAERDRIIAEAESRAARMRRDAQFVVDQQMKQLKADLTREAIEAAVKAAEEVLTAQTGAADQERLAKAYLGDVASSMNGKGEVQA